MYELYIYKISVLCCFQCAVRCVFSSELLYISITDKLCQYLFFIFLKFFSLKPSAFRSELANINTAVSACQYFFHLFLEVIFKINGGEGGIRTHVGLHPNGFQDRLVMTTSIPLQVSAVCCFLIGTFGMIPAFLPFVNRKFHFFSKKFLQW